MSNTKVTACLSLCGAMLFSGCSRSHELETAQVRGIVTLDGKPLQAGAVMFMPPRGRAATGIIQSDGTFTIGTYDPGDGAVVGRHNITVSPYFPDQTNEAEQIEFSHDVFTVRKRYSGIAAEVKQGELNEIRIDLASD